MVGAKFEAQDECILKIEHVSKRILAYIVQCRRIVPTQSEAQSDQLLAPSASKYQLPVAKNQQKNRKV